MSERIFDFQEPMDERRIYLELEDDVEAHELAGMVLGEIIEQLRDLIEQDPPEKFAAMTQEGLSAFDWELHSANAIKRAAGNFKGASYSEWKSCAQPYLEHAYERNILNSNDSETVGDFYYEDWAEEDFMMRDEIIELFDRMESAADDAEVDSDELRDDMSVEVREYVAMVAEELDPTSIFDVVDEDLLKSGYEKALAYQNNRFEMG